MKGTPLLRGLMMLAALLALLLPLRSLTRHPLPSPMPPHATAPATGVNLVLTSTEAPFTFAVTHLGKTVWQGDSTGNTISKTVEMDFPPEGIDLGLEIKWRVEKPAAARLDVTPKDGETISRTVWGTVKVSDVMTFSKP